MGEFPLLCVPCGETRLCLLPARGFWHALRDRGLKSALIADGRARVEVARERRLDGSAHLYPSRLIGVLSWRGLAIGVHMRRRCSTASMSSAALASCTYTSRRRPPTTAGARQLHPLAVPPQA